MSYEKSEGFDLEGISPYVEGVSPYVEKFLNHYSSGFFTPYRSTLDLGLAVVAPIAVPVALGVLSALFLIGAAVASVVFVGGLLVAAGAAAFDNEIAGVSLFVGVMAGLVGFLCTAVIPLLAILAAACLVEDLLKLVTRPAATIVNPMNCLCGDGEEDMLIDASYYAS